MARYLMDFCYFYEKEVCAEAVKKARNMSGPLRLGDPGPIFPFGKEQEKLDDI